MSMGVIDSVSLGKATVLWLVAIMEELLNAEVSKEFLKSSRMGSKSFIIQRREQRLSLFGHW
jgi:hypothetical protein